MCAAELLLLLSTPFRYHPRARLYIKHTNLWLAIFSSVIPEMDRIFGACLPKNCVCTLTCRNTTRAGNLTILLISKLLSRECHQVCVVNCLKQFRIPQSLIVCLSHTQQFLKIALPHRRSGSSYSTVCCVSSNSLINGISCTTEHVSGSH